MNVEKKNSFVFLLGTQKNRLNEAFLLRIQTCKSLLSASDLGPNTLKSIQIHYNYFDLSMITITLQLQDL